MLELEGVNGYYGKSHILHDVSLTVREDGITTLLGRNGAGKSTVIKSIMGLVTVRSGTITYKGEEITNSKVESRVKQRIGYIPEKRRILPNLTVEENLRLAQLSVEDPRDVDEVIDRFPNLQERFNLPGRNLSGGEQQMLAIARALIQDPEILLVDEPSEGLMPVLVERVFELLSDISDAGITVLLTEQQAENALRISDHAYIIDTGRVVDEGGPQVYLEDKSKLERYIGIHEA
jgi:branched-chain amino acid transport system ATP-binding protein